MSSYENYAIYLRTALNDRRILSMNGERAFDEALPVDTFQGLLQLVSKLRLTPPATLTPDEWERSLEEELENTSSFVGLEGWQRLRIRERVRQAQMLDLESETSELLSFDGNTVRRLKGTSLTTKIRGAKQTILSIYLGPENPSVSDVQEAIHSIMEWLEDLDVTENVIAGPSEFGSFFTSFTFVLKVGSYARTLVANLKTAFGAAAQSEKLRSVERLSQIVSKFSHAAIRIDNHIAVKVTRNRQTYVIIEEINPALDEELAKNPSLLKMPDLLYDTILGSQIGRPLPDNIRRLTPKKSPNP